VIFMQSIERRSRRIAGASSPCVRWPVASSASFQASFRHRSDDRCQVSKRGLAVGAPSPAQAP